MGVGEGEGLLQTKLVGVSCDQFEDKLLALFELIEARRDQSLADSLAMVPSVRSERSERD
jgi:hypothetical protein